MERYFQAKKAKEIVQKYFYEYIEEHDGENEVALISRQEWIETAGKQMSQHVKPIYVKNGVLLVESDHATWSYYISLKSNTIIATLNRNCLKKNRTIHKIKIVSISSP